jgi:uncharacterized protein (DUF1501 family)
MDKKFQEMNRRKFLKLVSAGTCGAALHGFLSPLDQFSAYAAPAVDDGKVLVLVNFAGGASYNIANPLNSVYMDKNKTVAYQAGVAGGGLAINSEQVLHPSLTALKTLYDEGSMALINLVGYAPPINRSHDESTDIWHSGFRSYAAAGTRSGWMARASDQTSNIYTAISLSGSNLIVSGGVNPPRAFGDLNNFGENGFWGGNDGTQWLHITRDLVMSDSPGLPQDNYNLVKGAINSLELSIDTIQKETKITLPVTFPNTGFGRGCRDAAKLIAARSLGVKLIYLATGGFDTHSGEKAALTSRLNEVNGGLSALIQTLKQLNRWNDVTILTMSEFSRTFENGSAGTDHGHSGAMFVLGGAVNGGVLTPAPTAAETSKGGYFTDYHVDFREVYKATLYRMGFNGDAVFPEPIKTRGLNLFKS